nr:MAG TPA: hypothetical protein [Caudoviricetes sp.]
MKRKNNHERRSHTKWLNGHRFLIATCLRHHIIIKQQDNEIILHKLNNQRDEKRSGHLL